MHIVYSFCVLHIGSAPLRQKLLAEHADEVSEVGQFGQLHILARELDVQLYTVANGREH